MAGEFFLFFGVQAAVRQGKQLGESHDGIQRGAYLVAHVLHKAGFGIIGHAHPFIGFPQFAVVDPEEESQGGHEQGEQDERQVRDAGNLVFLGFQICAEGGFAHGDFQFRNPGLVGPGNGLFQADHQILFQIEGEILEPLVFTQVGNDLLFPNGGQVHDLVSLLDDAAVENGVDEGKVGIGLPVHLRDLGV